MAHPSLVGSTRIRRYRSLWTPSLLSKSHSIHICALPNTNFFSQDVIQRCSRGCALSHNTPPVPLQASSSPCATIRRPNPGRVISSLPSGILSIAILTQRRRSSTSSLTSSKRRRRRPIYSMLGIRLRTSAAATCLRTSSPCPRLLARIMRVSPMAAL
jgi:hypothetical protein